MLIQHFKLMAAAVAAACAVMGVTLIASGGAVKGQDTEAPSYTDQGDLKPPSRYREWIYLTSGLDMSYSAKSGDGSMSMFDNVFVDPASYRSFLTTGTWPDKTMLVLEVRKAQSKGSINQLGHYQSNSMVGMEVHVKDEARFPGKWAFFQFDSPTKDGKLLGQSAPCYSCHAAHGAVDTTFVQFYPMLLPLAEAKGTLSMAYRNEAQQLIQRKSLD